MTSYSEQLRRKLLELLKWFRDEYSEEVWSIVQMYDNDEEFQKDGWNAGVWTKYHEKMNEVNNILS